MRFLLTFTFTAFLAAAVSGKQGISVGKRILATGETDDREEVEQRDEPNDNQDAVSELMPVGDYAEKEEFIIEGNPYPEQNPNCSRAGYYNHIFDEDQYEQQNWLNGGNRGIPKKAACKSNTVNARGTYTSHLVPCSFQFYHIPSEKLEDLDSFTMSTVCIDATPMPNHPEVEEYVAKWPDECVADFARCYHLERDEKLLLRHICKYSWKIPEGATHVRVDCTADKQEKIERGDIDPQDPYLKNTRDAWREFYMVLFAVVTICLLAGCIAFCFTYRYVIKPYLRSTMKRSKSDPEFASLKANIDSEKGE